MPIVNFKLGVSCEFINFDPIYPPLVIVRSLHMDPIKILQFYHHYRIFHARISQNVNFQ